MGRLGVMAYIFNLRIWKAVVEGYQIIGQAGRGKITVATLEISNNFLQN